MNLATLAACGKLFLAVLTATPQHAKVAVRHRDIDPYQHVNSAVYLEYLSSSLAQLSAEIPAPQSPSPADTLVHNTSLEIDFKKPIRPGSQVEVHWSASNPTPDGKLGFTIQTAGANEPSAIGKLNSLVLTPNSQNLPSGLEPIPFERTMDVRFHDLDTTNHVDYSQYLDYINSGSWQYLRDVYQITPQDITGKGIGFFMTRAEMEFGKPIKGIKQIKTKSWLAEINKDGSELVFPYEIWSADGATLHSRGKIYYAVIDLTSAKPKRTPFPDWIQKYFLKSTGN